MSNNWATTPFKNAAANEDTRLYQRCHCCNSLLRPPALNHEPVPFIMLHGTWLRDMGMEPGSRVIVEAGLGLITVRCVVHCNPFSRRNAPWKGRFVTSFAHSHCWF